MIRPDKQISARFATVSSYSPDFLLGPYAYLVQAALSLHRAPAEFGEAMRTYFVDQRLPEPARVLECLDAQARPPASTLEMAFAWLTSESESALAA